MDDIQSTTPPKDKVSSLLYPICFCVLVLFFFPVIVHAGSTPPTTTHTLNGTLGNNGWYRSNIDVTVTAADAESGPDTTTYWIDSGTPTVVDHDTEPVASFDNASYEQGFFLNINNWSQGYDGPGSPLAIYYRSSATAYDGNRSAAIAYADSDDNFHYWYNENWAKEYTPGIDIVVTGWARTVMFAGDYAYFEIWGQRSDGTDDELLGTSNHLDDFSWSWREATAQITVPTDKNYIYIKAGSVGSPAAIVYWDFAITEIAGAQAIDFSFTHTSEGEYTLHYFSDDNNGNVEPEKTGLLRKDTIEPNPWQIFTSEKQSCDHCYSASAEVRDVTSGTDISTAQYRFYTPHADQFWSDWANVDTIKLKSNGQDASDGETTFIRMGMNEINFGDSSEGPFRVQFRLTDMAGNLSTSPIYEIATPWIKTKDGSIFISGEITMGTPSTGEDHSNADVFSGDVISSFLSTPNWKEENYDHRFEGAVTIDTLLPAYSDIKLGAQSMSGNLPVTNGVYVVAGNYVISNSTIPSNYESTDLSTVIIVEGNLEIDSSLAVSPQNNTVFIVEGDVIVKSNVEEIGGFFIAQGSFNSDNSGKSSRPLIVNGSVITLGSFELPRDLGDSGPENNTNTPTEEFNWQADFVMDENIAQYLTNQQTEYIWQEVRGGP